MANTNKFNFNRKDRTKVGLVMISGVILIILGFLLGADAGRMWANFLLGTMLFLGIGLVALFFLATHTTAFGGWQILIQRVPEAMSTFIPVGSVFLLLFVGASILNQNHIYHWMQDFLLEENVTVGELRSYEEELAEHHLSHESAEHETAEHESGERHSAESDEHNDGAGHNEHAEASDYSDGVYAGAGHPIEHHTWEHEQHYYAADYKGQADDAVIVNPHYDEILGGKSAFLNKGFFGLRTLIYVSLWVLFAFLMRRTSLRQDKEGGLKLYRKYKVYAAIFMLIFGVTSSTMSWDFLMSIDAHWYSTLYGWYTAISLWVACVAIIILLLIFLKNRGYLVMVNENHLHDLGKYMFGFSVFWAYLWISQYLLIWYANIPEETTYFYQRWTDYNFLFFLNLVLNFVFPFLVLMTRGSKRRITVLGTVAFVLVMGHWLDLYLAIMPGTVGSEFGIGLPEIGFFLGFAGLFVYVVLSSLAKAPLMPQNHPFFKESVTHHT